jgi:hypothetical protein
LSRNLNKKEKRRMTRFATRKSEVELLEGFNIQVFNGFGEPADLDAQGLPEYGYRRRAADSMTVISWKNRFQQSYPGYTCDVLHKDGSVAHGNTKLKRVRN